MNMVLAEEKKETLTQARQTFIKETLMQRYGVFSDMKSIYPGNKANIDDQQLSLILKNTRFLKIDEIAYDDEYPKREAFENIITSVKNSGDYNFVYFIDGGSSGVNLYLGVTKNISKDFEKSDLSANDYSEILHSSISGNFSGTVFSKKGGRSNILNESQMNEEVFEKIQTAKRFSMITGVPSISEKDEQNNSKINFQGIDRLINSMYEASSWQILIICEPVSYEEVLNFKNYFYREYDKLFPLLKISSQTSIQESQQISRQVGVSKTENTTKGVSESKTKGESHSESYGESSDGTSFSETRGTSDSISEGVSTNESESTGMTSGKSLAGTIEIINKEVAEIIDFCDKHLKERINYALNKSFFKTSIYTFGQNKADLQRLNNNITSIFQGDKSSYSPMRAISLELKNEKENKERLKKISSLQTLNTDFAEGNSIIPLINSNPSESGSISLATFLTPKEISIIAGFPTKEVSGIGLSEGVDFGINIDNSNSGGICLGYVLSRGKELKENKIHISREHLNKHIFVAGVTGSGKTTTCQKILLESRLPWIVIEPAKTEYRILKEHDPSIEIYTLGAEDVSPFRINPFELIKGEKLSSHIDMLKAAFNASFPMEAAMPQLVEEAIHRCYERYGWDSETTKNKYSENPWDENGKYWCTMSDFLIELENVCTDKKFSLELQGNYIGSLVARFKSFTAGAKGRLLNCKKSFDFKEIITKKVVFELDELKDPSEKSFLMSLILLNISQAIKIKHLEDTNYRHITLIEEAHRLLSRTASGENNPKRLGIEIFCDMIAEVRKYGESLIISDQIPSKLVSDVIKNTNTKIIHKLFAKDDKETIANTMLLNEKQLDYLSRMKTGEAVIFTQDFNKSINIRIEKVTDTGGIQLSDEKIKESAKDIFQKNINVFIPWADINNCGREKAEKYYENKSERKKWFKDFNEIIDKFSKNDSFLEELKKLFSNIGEDKDLFIKEYIFLSYCGLSSFKECSSTITKMFDCIDGNFKDIQERERSKDLADSLIKKWRKS